MPFPPYELAMSPPGELDFDVNVLADATIAASLAKQGRAVAAWEGTDSVERELRRPFIEAYREYLEYLDTTNAASADVDVESVARRLNG